MAGIGVGGSKSKTKSTSDTTSTYDKTSTPTNPEWVTQGAQGLSDYITGLAGKDPKSFFADAGPLLQQQYGLAGQMGANSGGYLDKAGQMAGGLSGYNPQQMTAAQVGAPSMINGESALGRIGGYLDASSPYTQGVINPALADNERSRQMAGIDTAARATAAHAFGGSRHGIADAETNSAYDRNAQNFIGGLRNQGYQSALSAAQQDAQMGQQASIFNAGAQNANATTNAGFQQQAGLANQSTGLAGAQLNQQGQLGGAQILQQLGLSGYDAVANAGASQQGIAQSQAGAPAWLAQLMSGSYGNLPLSLFQGNTETGSELSKNKSKGTTTGISASASYGG